MAQPARWNDISPNDVVLIESVSYRQTIACGTVVMQNSYPLRQDCPDDREKTITVRLHDGSEITWDAVDIGLEAYADGSYDGDYRTYLLVDYSKVQPKLYRTVTIVI